MLVVPVTTVMPSRPVTIDLCDDYELPPQDFVLSPVLPEESSQHVDIERCKGKVLLILFQTNYSVQMHLYYWCKYICKYNILIVYACCLL